MITEQQQHIIRQVDVRAASLFVGLSAFLDTIPYSGEVSRLVDC